MFTQHSQLKLYLLAHLDAGLSSKSCLHVTNMRANGTRNQSLSRSRSSSDGQVEDGYEITTSNIEPLERLTSLVTSKNRVSPRSGKYYGINSDSYSDDAGIPKMSYRNIPDYSYLVRNQQNRDAAAREDRREFHSIKNRSALCLIFSWP